MSYNNISSKYAKSLFDVTYQNGKSGETAQQLLEISKAFSEEIIMFFKNPFNSQTDKLKVVNSTFEGKVSAELINFINLLVEKNRIGLVEEIAKEYSGLVQNAAGITKGKIYSAVNLTEGYIKQVEEMASKALNKKIELVFEKDESLIAGYKLQVGGWTLDDSANTHLKILKDELMKRGL